MSALLRRRAIGDAPAVDADKCSIADLFHQSRRHVVPLYQRAYVWREDDQWQPLWDDVDELALGAGAHTIRARAPPRRPGRWSSTP